MNIYKEVVNRNTIPPSADPDGLAKFHAEKLTASALTQTYHYMMEGGLEYGLLTTGEATVFLKVDWAEAPYIVLSLGRARARGLGSSRACAVQLRGGTVSRVQAARFPPSPLRNPATAREIPRETAVKHRVAPLGADALLEVFSGFEMRRSPHGVERRAQKKRRCRPGRKCDERNLMATRRDQSESSDDESEYRPRVRTTGGSRAGVKATFATEDGTRATRQAQARGTQAARRDSPRTLSW